MYQKFHYDHVARGEFDIFRLRGYLEDLGGSSLKEGVDKRLEEGQTMFVIDFQGIELISSPGVAALLDIVSRIIDDFDGKVSMFGLDSHHLAVLEMSGMFFLAEHSQDEPSAIKIVTGKEED